MWKEKNSPLFESVAPHRERNQYLKTMREQLNLFHGGLTSGDKHTVLEARREIQKARRRLERRSRWERALRWLTYVSVPVGIGEGLIWNISVAGPSFSVMGAAGTAASRHVEKGTDGRSSAGSALHVMLLLENPICTSFIFNEL